MTAGPQPSRGGYFPVRVKIANNLNSDRSVQLRFDSSMNYDNNVQTKSSFDLAAPAGKTITLLTAAADGLGCGVYRRILMVAPRLILDSVWPVEACRSPLVRARRTQ